MKLKNLHDVLIHQLGDIYFAEKQLVKALPKAAKAATDEGLRAAIEDHLEQTKHHVDRLEKAFDSLGVPAKAQRCPAILGLIEETEEYIKGDHEPEARDAGLIACAQRVEHYEIAAYGCARAYARQLGHNSVATLLDQTLGEEGDADQTLTRIAESGVNQSAVSGDESAQNGARSRSKARRPAHHRAGAHG